jgi:mannose-6-phosphate isomerase
VAGTHAIVGAAATPRVLVCVAGNGQLDHDGVLYTVGKGDVLLLPAAVGACSCFSPGTITLLELSLPEGV